MNETQILGYMYFAISVVNCATHTSHGLFKILRHRFQTKLVPNRVVKLKEIVSRKGRLSSVPLRNFPTSLSYGDWYRGDVNEDVDVVQLIVVGIFIATRPYSMVLLSTLVSLTSRELSGPWYFRHIREFVLVLTDRTYVP